MLQFALTFLFLSALAAVCFVVARTLPRIDEAGIERKNPVERWLASEMPEKLDAAFESFLSKSIRRAKVWTLKTDNRLNAWSARMNRPVKPLNETLLVSELKQETKPELSPEEPAATQEKEL